MPSLTIPITKPIDRASHTQENRDGSTSPSAPPYSPITPVLSTAPLAPVTASYRPPPPAPAERPPLLPISESDNSDAIALRAALSVLQIQRQQALRDIKTLQRQKQQAVADPEQFVNGLKSGDIKSAATQALIGPFEHSQEDAEMIDADTEDNSASRAQSNTFGTIPAPQNVIRCPPINWAKYHVVGESLDKLHDEQRRRPTPGVPNVDYGTTMAPSHVIAAPYRPWADKLPESSMRTRSDAKK